MNEYHAQIGSSVIPSPVLQATLDKPCHEELWRIQQATYQASATG